LEAVKVLEAATLFAGPLAATFLGDFGADVTKIEHPSRPDAARGHGTSKDGVGLWFKTLGRNKRLATLDLSQGREVFLELVRANDVLVENFRPGTLERWGLGPEVLLEANPRLVIARVTAFGQVGPWSSRPGFGSLAEAMSGFAAVTGEPDGPPTLPPFGLADGITALATAYAVLVALRERDRSGAGQVIDMAIIEPILMMLGGQITAYQQTGYVQPRLGNRSSNNAPRTSTRPPTVVGSPSRPVRRASRNEWSRSWAGRIWSRSPGSGRGASGPSTRTSWTMPLDLGSGSALWTRSCSPSRRRRPRSGRCMTSAGS